MPEVHEDGTVERPDNPIKSEREGNSSRAPLHKTEESPVLTASKPDSQDSSRVEVSHPDLQRALDEYRREATAISAFHLANECVSAILDARNDFEQYTPGVSEEVKWRKGSDRFLVLHGRRYWISYDEFPIMKPIMDRVSAQTPGPLTQVDSTAIDELARNAYAQVGMRFPPTTHKEDKK